MGTDTLSEGEDLKVVRSLVLGIGAGAAGMALYEVADEVSWSVLRGIPGYGAPYVLAGNCFAGAISGLGVGLLWPRGHVILALAGPSLAWVRVFGFGNTWHPLNWAGTVVAVAGAALGWLVLHRIGARRHPTIGETPPCVVPELHERCTHAEVVVSSWKPLPRCIAIGLCVGFGLPFLLTAVPWEPAALIAILPMMILAAAAPESNELGWAAFGLNWLLWAGLGALAGLSWGFISGHRSDSANR